MSEEDRSLTDAEVWKDGVHRKIQLDGDSRVLVYSLCTLRLITKDSSYEAEPLEPLNKPHGLP